MKLLRSKEELTVINDIDTGPRNGETTLDDFNVEFAGTTLSPEYEAVTTVDEGYSLSKEEAPGEEVLYDKPDEGLKTEILDTSVGGGAGYVGSEDVTLLGGGARGEAGTGPIGDEALGLNRPVDV